MRKPFVVLIFAALLILATHTSLSGQQVTAGFQPLGSFSGGPDVINLGNLNTHWDVPIRSKVGRGLNFSYTLGYDSSIWVKGATWTPVSNWGWTAETQTATGYVTATTNLWKCFQGTSWYWATTYANWVYIDRHGTPHGFSLPTISDCPRFPSSASGTTGDGSGYHIDASPGAALLHDAGGHPLYPPFNSGTGSGTAIDNNGNEITFNGITFTDTLGKPVLTISGTNPVTLSYTGPSGAVSYSMSYVSHTVKTNFGCSGVAEFGPTSVSLVDKVTLPDNSYYQFTYEPTPGYSGDVTGRIASVKLPTGGTISYSYSGGSNGITCLDGSTATLTRTTPDGQWSYAHTESGSAWTTTVTDPRSDETTINFQGLGGSAYETERQVNDVSKGLLETILTCYNGAAPNCNATAITLPISRRSVFTEPTGGKNLESEIDATLNGYGRATKVDEYDYGSNSTVGPLLRETQITYASLANDIQDHPAQVSVYAGSNLNTPVAQTTYTYDQGSVITTSGTPQHVSVGGSRGNLTTVVSLVQASTSLTKTFTYYDTGNVYQATDTNNAVTTYTYGGCTNSFPTQVSLPMSLSISAIWDCNGSVKTQTTDANNQPTQISYGSDPFWRPITITDPETNVTTNTYTSTTRESVLNFSSSTVDVLTTLDSMGRTKLVQKRQGQAPGVTNFDTVQDSYDSNGRLTQATQPCVNTAGNGCSGAATTTSYDALNRPATVTDGVGGTLSYTYANNDILQDLGPAPAGENDKKKQLEYDGLGRLSSVCEVTGASGSSACSQNTGATGFYTSYSYDVLGDMTGVAQGASQTRTYGYDGLGRIKSETNPESGTTRYFYDSNGTGTGACPSGWGSSSGDLISKYDANGYTSCFAYDSLHRVTGTWYYGSNVNYEQDIFPSKHFGWDSGSLPGGTSMQNAKTRLVEASTCTAGASTCVGNTLTDEYFSYDANGRQTDFYECTPHSGSGACGTTSGGYYHAAVTYWPNGVLNTLGGVAQQSTYTYGVDPEGRLYSATQGSTQYVSSTTYNTASQPLTVSLYNNDGDNDAYLYDSIGRLTNYTFTVGSTPKSMAGVLTWNTNSSLSKLVITDGFNSSGSQTCKYGDPSNSIAGYDDLGRLISVSCNSSPAWSQTFSFDPYGNITKSGNSAWMPGYNESTNRYSGTSYDSNGNLLNDTFHSYLWDAFNHPTTVTSPNGPTTCGSNGVTCLTYDALGRVVEKNVTGTNSEIEYSPIGKVAVMNGTTQLQAYIPLPGGEILSPAPDTFWHRDWLGSMRFGSFASGRTATFDRAFAPYGELYNTVTGGTTQADFTGLTLDTISDEYDTATRELHPGQSRWISPDAAGMSAVNPADPQTWNRYGYVRNNPLGAIDPTGMMMCASMHTCGYGGGGGGWGWSDDDILPIQLDPGQVLLDGVSTSASIAQGALGMGFAAYCPGNCVISVNGILAHFVAYANSGSYTPYAGPGSIFDTNDQAMIAGAMYAENQALGGDGKEQCGVASPVGDQYTYSVPIEGTSGDCQPAQAMTSDFQKVSGFYHGHGAYDPANRMSEISDFPPGHDSDQSLSDFWTLPFSLQTPGGNLLIYYPNAISPGQGCQTFFLGGPAPGSTIPVCP